MVERNKMCELNILILSAGRRVELIQCFKNAAQKLNIKSNIVAADCTNTAPALYFADKFHILPRIFEPDYIDQVIDICNQENIRLIIPTIDTDLLLLAENKEYIEEKTNAKVLISNKQVIKICRNKINTQSFLEENKFGVPRLFTDEELENGDIQYPLFIKPIDGSSSKNTFKVQNENELKVYRNSIVNPIVQEYIEGEEYTVDVFLDFYSNIITIVPRIRLATRSGEIIKGKISKNRMIIDDVTRLMQTLNPIGQITVQCMLTKNGIKYIEINPRFGGGAPMSIQSGADSCINLYKLLLGEKLEYNEDYKTNLLYLRYDSCICLDEDMELLNDKGSGF